jgi:DNA repair exonuclease SbcCD ATPase subunit
LYSKIKSDETSPEDRLLLNQLGLNLAGDVCPLCDTPWDPDELKSHLSSKLENLKEVQEDLERIKEVSDEISELVKNKLSIIGEVLKASKLLELDQETYYLMVWEENLLRITASMDSDDYRGDSLPEAAPLGEVGNCIFTVATERYQTTFRSKLPGII